jgi:hypothetical protein
MCIGIGTGGMTVTTVYSAATGDPVALIAGLAGMAAAIALAVMLVKFDIISLQGRIACHGTIC